MLGIYINVFEVEYKLVDDMLNWPDLEDADAFVRPSSKRYTCSLWYISELYSLQVLSNTNHCLDCLTGTAAGFIISHTVSTSKKYYMPYHIKYNLAEKQGPCL